MMPPLVKSPRFLGDLDRIVEWYLEEAGEEIARRFVSAVSLTLKTIRRNPALGRIRFPGLEDLRDVQSRLVEPPFNRYAVFYRIEPDSIQVLRLIHGARDLPRRFQEPFRS